MECVGGGEEDPTLPAIQSQLAGMDDGLVTPWTQREVGELVGHQVDGGLVLATVGAETQGPVLGHGTVLAQLLHVHVALLDGVHESVGVVQVTPHFVRKSRRIAGGAQVEIVTVVASADDVQFPSFFQFFFKSEQDQTFVAYTTLIEKDCIDSWRIHLCSVEELS